MRNDQFVRRMLAAIAGLTLISAPALAQERQTFVPLRSHHEPVSIVGPFDGGVVPVVVRPHEFDFEELNDEYARSPITLSTQTSAAPAATFWGFNYPKVHANEADVPAIGIIATAIQRTPLPGGDGNLLAQVVNGGGSARIATYFVTPTDPPQLSGSAFDLPATIITAYWRSGILYTSFADCVKFADAGVAVDPFDDTAPGARGVVTLVDARARRRRVATERIDALASAASATTVRGRQPRPRRA